MIEKYKNKIDIGTYLAIKEEIEDLKRGYEVDIEDLKIDIRKLQEENEKVAPYIEYVSKIKTASFAEKLKFLFGRN